jgi:hypothetical protein
MAKTGDSYKKVPYDLRASKQIERRMIIDALMCLSRKGFDIAEYQYTGMGSVHFVDFILFHRILGIHRMLSAEISTDIPKRIKFNKPYKYIDVFFGGIGDTIPTLDTDLQHILWLDYDFKMDGVITTDVVNACAALSPGSILLITVDVESPIENEPSTPRKCRNYYLEKARKFCDPGWPLSDYVESQLHALNVRILRNAIQSGLTGRRNVSFHPLFNFSYADGHEMLTIGGMIGTTSQKSLLDACDFLDGVYLRRSFDEPEYRIPKFVITRKEKLYLDSAMPASRNWKPKEFEMDEGLVRQYSDVYRFYPSYAELML